MYILELHTIQKRKLIKKEMNLNRKHLQWEKERRQRQRQSGHIDVPTMPLAVLEHNKSYLYENGTVMSGSEVQDGALVSEVDHVLVSRAEFELIDVRNNLKRSKTMWKRCRN